MSFNRLSFGTSMILLWERNDCDIFFATNRLLVKCGLLWHACTSVSLLQLLIDYQEIERHLFSFLSIIDSIHEWSCSRDRSSFLNLSLMSSQTFSWLWVILIPLKNMLKERDWNLKPPLLLLTVKRNQDSCYYSNEVVLLRIFINYAPFSAVFVVSSPFSWQSCPDSLCSESVSDDSSVYLF